ncbi:MAG: efflux RND transporter periplasmic adaptor subunit [Planctomycetales bacterium]
MNSDSFTRLSRGALMLAALAGIVALVGSLVRSSEPGASPASPSESMGALRPAVQVDARGLIQIDPDSALHRQLTASRLEQQQVRFGALRVSGSVIARLRPGEEPAEGRWQFSDTHLAATYADWLQQRAEVEFARKQLAKTQELGQAQTDYLDANLRRLEPLWKSGNLPERDYKAAQADLLKAQLQGDKDLFAAESTLRQAQNSRMAQERDLARDGIDPALFTLAPEHVALIAAHVPEIRIAQVQAKQNCVARFYAYPGRDFTGEVGALSPLLAHERRTLRVLFQLSDAEGLLRPGMFADVELGTGDRQALLVPEEGLLRLGSADYVFVQSAPGDWRPQKVRVGERYQESYEVLEGIAAGEVLLVRGAFLLKPAAEQALRASPQE